MGGQSFRNLKKAGNKGAREQEDTRPKLGSAQGAPISPIHSIGSIAKPAERAKEDSPRRKPGEKCEIQMASPRQGAKEIAAGYFLFALTPAYSSAF
jgi:hypothetical protein